MLVGLRNVLVVTVVELLSTKTSKKIYTFVILNFSGKLYVRMYFIQTVTKYFNGIKAIKKQQSNHPHTGKKLMAYDLKAFLDRALSTRWFIRTSAIRQDKLPPIAHTVSLLKKVLH